MNTGFMQVLRSTLAGTLAGVSLAACGSFNDIKKHVITKSDTTNLLNNVEKESGLTVGEVKMLIGRQIRMAFTQKQGDPIFPEGKTIGDVLEEEKTLVADTAKKDATDKALRAKILSENKSKIDLLKKTLHGAVASKTFSPSDPTEGKYEDLIELHLGFQNASDKPIKAFKGIFRFYTQLGDRIQSLQYSGDDLSEPLMPGKLTVMGVTTKFNQFVEQDVKFKNTSLESMKVEFLPTAILFTDGSRIDLPDEVATDG